MDLLFHGEWVGWSVRVSLSLNDQVVFYGLIVSSLNFEEITRFGDKLYFHREEMW